MRPEKLAHTVATRATVTGLSRPTSGWEDRAVPLRDLAMLDDATIDATGVRVTDGRVVLHGWAVEHGTSAGTARLPVTLTVPYAVDVSADSVGRTGDLVLERIDVTPTTVTLVGVAPARVVVTTSAQSQALLDVGDDTDRGAPLGALAALGRGRTGGPRPSVRRQAAADHGLSGVRAPVG